MILDNFKIFYEQPKQCNHYNWMDTKVNNNNYVLDIDQFENIIDVLDIKENDVDKETKFWFRVNSLNWKNKKKIIKKMSPYNVGVIYEEIFTTTDVRDINEVSKLLGRKILIECHSIGVIEALANNRVECLGVIVKGNEASGVISEQTTSILLRYAQKHLKLPLYIRGGVGVHTLKAYCEIGCQGVYFEHLHLGIKSMNYAEDKRDALLQHSTRDSVIVGRDVNLLIRISSRNKKLLEQIKSIEQECYVSNASDANKMLEFYTKISNLQGIEYISQEIGQLKKYVGCTDISQVSHIMIENIRGRRENATKEFLAVNNCFAQRYKCKYPIIQGPMAHTTDSVEFATNILAAGSIPVLALGGKRKHEAISLIKEFDINLNGNYGIGIIGFEKNLDQYLLEELKKSSARFILIAGPKANIVKELYTEKKLLLHTPDVSSFQFYYDLGIKDFVFEGYEAGGHVGKLSLFTLIEEISDYIENSECDYSGCNFVFAGGICDCESIKMINSLNACFNEREIGIGIQIGTAYLYTKEAKSCNIISDTYAEIILKNSETQVICEEIGEPLRVIQSDYIHKLISAKNSFCEDKLSVMREMKAGRLFIASKGKKIIFGEKEENNTTALKGKYFSQ